MVFDEHLLHCTNVHRTTTCAFLFSKVKCVFSMGEIMKIWNSSKVIKAIKFNATLFSVYDSNSYTSLILHLRSEKLLRFTSFNLHKLDALELYAENIYVVGKNSRNIELPFFLFFSVCLCIKINKNFRISRYSMFKLARKDFTQFKFDRYMVEDTYRKNLACNKTDKMAVFYIFKISVYDSWSLY